MLIEDAKNFRKVFNGSINNIFNMKLRVLLEQASSSGVDPLYTCQLPPVGMGSITLVDQIAIICLLKIFKPQNILEIGTFKGYTTHLLLQNSSENAAVTSIDLPIEATGGLECFTDDAKARADGDYNDNYLRLIQAKQGRPHLVGLPDRLVKKLRLIEEDSTNINFSKTLSELDFAFIDGGHHIDIVKTDTLNVLSVMRSGVIIWHDYGSLIHNDVTRYLESELRLKMKIFSIENSLIAFSIIGGDGSF